jgi:hypothetical protein
MLKKYLGIEAAHTISEQSKAETKMAAQSGTTAH